MKKYFPLKKEHISINRSKDEYLSIYKNNTEIPMDEHPGSFGFKRKNHIHEGIDLYAEDGDSVYAIEDGIIVNIVPFTGVIADSPWWNDTYSIMIEHKDVTINYGEITPNQKLNIGENVKAGDIIGKIKTVLIKNKGRPMSMLHLEMYTKGTIEPLKEWTINKEKPDNLLNPTEFIKSLVRPR